MKLSCWPALFSTGASFSEAEKAILALWRKAGLMERKK